MRANADTLRLCVPERPVHVEGQECLVAIVFFGCACLCVLRWKKQEKNKVFDFKTAHECVCVCVCVCENTYVCRNVQ